MTLKLPMMHNMSCSTLYVYMYIRDVEVWNTQILSLYNFKILSMTNPLFPKAGQIKDAKTGWKSVPPKKLFPAFLIATYRWVNARKA